MEHNLVFKDKALLEKARSFLKNVTKEDRVAIIHHTDSDGICSGTLLMNTIERLRKSPADLRHNQKSNEHKLTPQTIDLLRGHEITKLIITDITADEGEEALKTVAEFADVLLIDHHKVMHTFPYNRHILMVKPQLIYENADPAKYCCSKFVYDICSPLVNLSDRDWVACVGTIGDISTTAWPEFVTKVHEKYKVPLEPDYFATTLGKVSTYLTDAEAFDPTLVGTCVSVIMDSKSPEDVLHSELHAYHLKVKDEFAHWMGVLEEQAEVSDRLIMMQLQPKFNIKSALSTTFSQRFPHHVLVLYTQIGDKITISMRSSDYSCRMNDLIEFAVKGLANAQGGGHIPAAGGSILATDLPVFKERVMNAITSNKFKNT